MAKKTYVLDTSVYLTDAQAIKCFGDNDIIVPLKVLEEIDNHKKRQDSVGSNARQIIRILDELRTKGSLYEGVGIGEGLGQVFARPHEFSNLPSDFEKTDPDNIIISTALAEKKNKPDREVILVSRDINMRVKCDAIGLDAEDYNTEQIIERADHLYDGFRPLLVDAQTIDQFYDGEKIYVEEDEQEEPFYPNQFVMLVSNSNEKKTALAKFHSYNMPLKKMIEHSGIWGVRPRNKEQNFAMNLLMDPNVKVLSLVGRAGSGKTLCALAAGLEQVLEPPNSSEDVRYRKLIVSRPIEPMGRDIGFLPGTLEEKMDPWISPIRDNLEYLMGADKKTLDMYLENGIIEIEALTYIRGRSIANAYIIIDECQQLTQHEVKTILTRVGEGTKIILTGDVEQIDNVYVDEISNGLTYAVEKFKPYDVSGHITLLKGERSKVASLAAKIL